MKLTVLVLLGVIIALTTEFSTVTAGQILSDQVVVTPNGENPLVFPFAEGPGAPPDFRADFYSGTFAARFFQVGTDPYNVVIDFVEKGDFSPFSPPLSDRLIMKVDAPQNNQRHISLTFGSDPDIPPLPSGTNVRPDAIVEKDDPIDITNKLFINVDATHPAPFTVTIQSDVEPVPEPSTLVSASVSAMVCLGYLRRRQQRITR